MHSYWDWYSYKDGRWGWDSGRNRNGCGERRKYEEQREWSHLRSTAVPNTTKGAYPVLGSSAEADAIEHLINLIGEQIFIHFLHIRVYEDRDSRVLGSTTRSLCLLFHSESDQRARDMAQGKGICNQPWRSKIVLCYEHIPQSLSDAHSKWINKRINKRNICFENITAGHLNYLVWGESWRWTLSPLPCL